MQQPFNFSNVCDDAVQALEDAGFSVSILDGVWVTPTPLAVEAFLASTAPKAFIQANKIKRIKERSNEHILARYPIWKQMNMNARANELTDKRMAHVQGNGQGQGNGLTNPEQAEAEALREVFAWIKSVRAYSDALEVQVNDTEKTWQQVAAINVEAGWPA